MYAGTNSGDTNFEKYQKILENKDLCAKIFEDKKVLKASQEALKEVNIQKIIEANNNGNREAVKTLETLNALLEKSLVDNEINQQENKKTNSNVAFKSIFDLFHGSNETLKQKAEVVVNRYASSAAATAAALANTGFGDTAALTLITKNLCKNVFKIYDCSGGYIAAITAASVGAVAGTNLLTKAATIWPGAGNALNATITYSLHQLEGRALIELLEENADELNGIDDADALTNFISKVKAGVSCVRNEKVREILSKAIDKAFDLLL